MIKILINSVFIFALLSSTSISNADWNQVKQTHNVKLFRSTLEADQYISRIEAEVNAPLQTLIDVVKDPNACNKWLYRCQTAHHISQTDDANLYLYYVRDYPFPLKDRHGVLQIQVEHQSNGEFVLNLELRKNMTPEESTLVIPETFKAQIRLAKITDDKTKVYLEHQLNPGGKIPNWLKQSIHEEFPFNSMLGLIESAQSRRHTNH
ncbi:START domain-containing protein [Litoribrevibacter albus]|uniref:START domain-containing protein n=1 Tax=Litoribrevibacter albus TaxID=1473156 RepID=A0AA37W5W6_9GAMM|nr:START domain-containing protein [Litoribrevibacter albus]GLQ31045.1 hypothetical protein GCM10007876_15240 [Litoribrevibacter albus]